MVINYNKRLQNLQKNLLDIPCDALIVDDAINLFYLTGLEISQGMLVVSKTHAYLLVDNRYFELCQKISPFPVLLADQMSSTFTNLLQNEYAQVKKLAFNSETTSYKSYIDLQAYVNKIVEYSKSRELILVPANNPVKLLRSIKDHQEIALLKTAAELGSRGFDYVCTLLKEGIQEKEIALELEIFWKKQGGKAIAFDPIIAFGHNSSMPHYRAGNAILKRGDCVLIDIGVNYEHYHSDMTRVVFFKHADDRILSIYAIVQTAQKAALDLCRPGTLIGELDFVARKIIESNGYGENFKHSLGHGVGLEIHEWPTLRNKPPYQNLSLQEGMVITIEPGIYLPNIGGVRLEDTIVITSTGYENLTQRSVKPKIIE